MLCCAAFAVTSCLLATPKSSVRVAAASSAVPELTVVIVTLDGVRWQEVFEGVDAKLAATHGLTPAEVVRAEDLMPNLHAIVATHGAALGAPGHGAAISASGPDFVSLPGYAELFSGRRATECKNNGCARSGARTVVDELADVSQGPGAPVAVFTSWPEIERVAVEHPRGAAISSGRHGGATRDVFSTDPALSPILLRAENVAPWPGGGDFRPDSLTAELALRHLRAHAPKFLFVGLGEPDEYGHHDDYAGYLNALRASDARIGELDRELQRLATEGRRTVLFVTADHGRADSFKDHGWEYPESSRVWLVAAGSAIRPAGMVSAPTERRLADLAPTVRAIAGLPPDTDSNAGNTLAELLAL